jgi:hypothetical protein
VLGAGVWSRIRWWRGGVSGQRWLVPSELIDDCYLDVSFCSSSTEEPLDILNGDFLVWIFLFEFFLKKFSKSFKDSDDNWVSSD